MRIGVIGAGFAGLTAQWMLRNFCVPVDIQLTLLSHREVAKRPLEIGDHKVDIPLRLSNFQRWPNFCKLAELLGAEKNAVDCSLSFGSQLSRFAFQFSLHSIFASQVLASIWQPGKRQLIQEAASFRSAVDNFRCESTTSCETFVEFLNRHSISDNFRQTILYPILTSTVCTCSSEALDNYPSRVLVDAIERITAGMLADQRGLSKLRLGVADLESRLLASLRSIRSPVHVKAVKRTGDEVVVSFYEKQGGNVSETFDHVVIATQANQARPMIGSELRNEHEMLSCFDYEDVRVVVHSDADLMPKNRKHWAAFNFINSDQSHAPESMCSVWVNRMAPELKLGEDLFQTINPIIEPDPAKVHRTADLQRPTVTRNSFRGWRMIDEMNAEPDRRIWFAGSYASYGVPLLESAVASAIKVVKALGAELPPEFESCSETDQLAERSGSLNC